MIACISIKANGLLIIYSKHVYVLIVLGSYIFMIESKADNITIITPQLVMHNYAQPKDQRSNS